TGRRPCASALRNLRRRSERRRQRWRLLLPLEAAAEARLPRGENLLFSRSPGARLSSRPSTLPAPVQAVCGRAEAAGATPTPPRVAGLKPKSERCTTPSTCW
ncbi:unnamed protein product, partial [Ectocarpus sp. 8 AP-2014]